MVPFVDTKPERASVLAEPVMTPSVVAELGDLTPSVLAPSVVPDGAGAEELIPASSAIRHPPQLRISLGQSL